MVPGDSGKELKYSIAVDLLVQCSISLFPRNNIFPVLCHQVPPRQHPRREDSWDISMADFDSSKGILPFSHPFFLNVIKKLPVWAWNSLQYCDDLVIVPLRHLIR